MRIVMVILHGMLVILCLALAVLGALIFKEACNTQVLIWDITGQLDPLNMHDVWMFLTLTIVCPVYAVYFKRQAQKEFGKR